MGCAASTARGSGVPMVISNIEGVPNRPLKLNESGKLDLSELDLKELPLQVQLLGKGVLDLALEKNSIDTHTSSFGDTLKALVILKRINLEGNRLTDVPGCIVNSLPKLEQLVLANNAIKMLPPSVRELGTLVELNLDRNFLALLPEEIGDLGSLRILSAAHNVLVSLPDGIAGCQRLDTLWLQHNRIRELCAPLCALAALEDLNLHDNRLSTLPAEMPCLTRVRWLSVGKNRFEKLPAQVFAMPALQTLHLQDNRLMALPPPMPPRARPLADGEYQPAHAVFSDPFGAARDHMQRDSFITGHASSDAAEEHTSPLGSPPTPVVQETPKAAHAEMVSLLRIVWLSGNPLCSEAMPPPTLMQLPHLEECRMKADSHGKCAPGP